MSPTKERVLLIEPKNSYYTGFQGIVQSEPYGLECVAGAITDIVEDVAIHDDRVSETSVEESIRVFKPTMVGIRDNYTADVPAGQDLARKVREEVGKDVPIIVGGHHISLMPKDMFIPEVNAVVVGPGEKPFREVISAWSKRHSLEGVREIWYQNEDGRFLPNVTLHMMATPNDYTYDSEDMNERPKPRRDLVDKYRDDYFFLYYPSPYSVETARGCRFRCTFCSIPQFHHGRYEVEPATRTVDEIEELVKKGTRYINMVDDLAFSNIQAAEAIAKGIIERGLNIRIWAQIRADNVWPKDEETRKEHHRVFELLAEAGLDTTLIGLESFDQKELARVKKGTTVDQNINAVLFLRERGIKIWGAQIVFPQWVVEDYDRMIEINQQLGTDYPQITILTPLPGTKDYFAYKAQGELLTEDPARFDFFHWTIATALPPEETYRQISRVYRETSSFGKRADGSLVSMRNAIRQRKSMEEDLRLGRTTEEAIAAFSKRFRDLQDEEVHLAHLARVSSAVA